MSTARRLYAPQAVEVSADGRGRPQALAGIAVEAIPEDWKVEDRWWTGQPLRRHYFELALVSGANATVFCDLSNGRWYRQRV